MYAMLCMEDFLELKLANTTHGVPVLLVLVTLFIALGNTSQIFKTLVYFVNLSFISKTLVIGEVK